MIDGYQRRISKITQRGERGPGQSQSVLWAEGLGYCYTLFSVGDREMCQGLLISCFEAFKWTHDPSEQLKGLIERGFLSDDFSEIASYVKEAAP